MHRPINVALIGNPNTGKTSIFNALTGLNQNVGNYPGVTVQKKSGRFKLLNGESVHLLDLPGTYSLNATSLDENVVTALLLDKEDINFPDVAVVVSDVENLKRNLLLFTQIKDLEIPTILVINMSDRMAYKGISLDIEYLETQLNTKIALVSTRKSRGINDLKTLISDYKTLSTKPCLNPFDIDSTYFNDLESAFPEQSLYNVWLQIAQDVDLSTLDPSNLKAISDFKASSEANLKRLQQKETIKRYQFINNVLKKGEFIDEQFAALSDWIKTSLPEGTFTNLLAEGIIPGLGGVVIFIPQIAFLFFFMAVLEETGYMSRIVFLMDRIMKRFGLSGKSVVPLISGTACAILAIMAARNIENWKERLITILVTPFTTCSARLPVYLIVIALVIPEGQFLGLSYQALTLMLLYILGFAAAVGSAYILHRILKTNHKSFFVVEMPNYKRPLLKNVAITVIEKTKSFVFGAGKIILAISIVLWFLASYGPSEQFNNAEAIITEQYASQTLSQDELEQKIASHKLEHSFIGITGRAIEPVIKPLGYDWKIGIGIISSFAAREVFVGTLATIYSVGSEEEDTIKNRMAAEVNPTTGNALYNLASGISLLLFYAFAMQCMSTLAIVKRETNSWKWPMIQLIAMSLIAYIVALGAFQILK